MKKRAQLVPLRKQSARSRQIMIDLAILAAALTRRPRHRERAIVERWLAAREKRV
jgi:hypothetical protein